jgi:hypothetical protein
VGVSLPVAVSTENGDSGVWPALLLLAGAGIMCAGLVLRRHERS